MINKVTVIGNLGRDPETRYSQDGKAICNFTVAATESWKDKTSGEMRDITEWVRCVAFGRLGEVCGQYLHKGKQVYVEGKMRTRSWEKDGITRYTTEVHISEMKMLGTKAERSEPGVPQTPRNDQPFDDGSDIPF